MDDLGIDHNISSLFGEGVKFASFCGRKKIHRENENFMVKDTLGNSQKMNALHFQGRYKIGLLDYYQHRQIPFLLKSMYIGLEHALKQ